MRKMNLKDKQSMIGLHKALQDGGKVLLKHFQATVVNCALHAHISVEHNLC